jgi:phosphoglycerate kinase
MRFRTLEDLPGDLTGKRALVRVDLNVPMDGERVTDSTRLEAAVPTIAALADRGAKVLLLAHFGRPKGGFDPRTSLKHVVHALAAVLGRQVGFLQDLSLIHI